MFGQMRAARERDERERKARYRRWRSNMASEYGVPDDLSALHVEFCRAMLKNCAPEQIPRALLDCDHPPLVGGKKTLRCRWFGCRAMGPCEFEPWCTNCRGRCRRCGNPVLTRASARKG